MADLPDLKGRVILDTADLDRAVQSGAEKGSKLGSAIGSAVGNLAAGGLAAGLGAVTNFVGGSVEAFSRYEDAAAAAGTVFGTAFGTVSAFADTAAKALGISKTSALDASITFGTFGKAAGLAGEPLAGFSTDMVTLAGNMASFRGTSPEEAITAIGAALRGERDPIEKYGVLINDAAVKQQALKMGLYAGTGELSNQAKIMATAALITQQTSDATGDFARTADSTANVQKTLAAETENAQAALGEKLAPVITALRTLLLGVITGISGFIDGMIAMVGWVQQNADIIGAVVAVLLILNAQLIASTVASYALAVAQNIVRVATMAWTAVQWLLNAALLANPIGLIIAAVVAIAAAFVIAWNRSETFRTFIINLWDTITGWASAAWDAITGFVQAIGEGFATAWQWVQDFLDNIGGFPGLLLAILEGVPGLVIRLLVWVWSLVHDAVVEKVTAILAWIAGVPGWFVDRLAALGTLLWGWITAAWNVRHDRGSPPGSRPC